MSSHVCKSFCSSQQVLLLNKSLTRHKANGTRGPKPWSQLRRSVRIRRETRHRWVSIIIGKLAYFSSACMLLIMHMHMPAMHFHCYLDPIGRLTRSFFGIHICTPALHTCICTRAISWMWMCPFGGQVVWCETRGVHVLVFRRFYKD